MGRSIALTLAREGAVVVINYRTSEQSARQIVDHIRNREGQAWAIQADICTAQGCAELVRETVEQCCVLPYLYRQQ
jgi:NAD(P)-dependent dehydrogenase (short-subunit alcohol dehydrogenase family)